MISIETLMNIICTESIEYGGLQEVPDRADGTIEHYHSLKRNARGEYKNGDQRIVKDLSPISFDLELIEDTQGRLHWEE